MVVKKMGLELSELDLKPRTSVFFHLQDGVMCLLLSIGRLQYGALNGSQYSSIHERWILKK